MSSFIDQPIKIMDYAPKTKQKKPVEKKRKVARRSMKMKEQELLEGQVFSSKDSE